MKKLLIFSMVFVGFAVYAETVDTPVAKEVSESQDTRSPFFQTIDLPMKMSFFEKCLLAGKGLSAGAMSTLFGLCCYLNATGTNASGTKESGFINKLQSLCVASAAFVGAAKFGGYSIRSLKTALDE